MMSTLTVVLPLLPGKQEAWRQFCQALQGSRRDEYAAWRERMGISQEQMWLTQTGPWDLVRIRLEVERPESILPHLMTADHPFERWVRQRLLELHGLDVKQLASTSAHELLFAWQPTPFRGAASEEEQNYENKERNT